MTLINSISGIRGTIGGALGEGLNPVDAARFSAAYGAWIKKSAGKNAKIVIGRDARPSGPMLQNIVVSTLLGMGIDVVDAGLSTTPTVEVAVGMEQASGGIILTASHNPVNWNALKLLNEKGEFLSAEQGREVLHYLESEEYTFSPVEEMGTLIQKDDFIQKHIDAILALPLVNVEAIRKANFKVAIDCVNSSGGVALPPLLKALGVEEVKELFCEPTGWFPHNPEPLPAHLTEISEAMKSGGYDVGFVVDPDVDRLCMVNEDGTMFGEEYTLVAVAEYVLSQTPGATVSNLSSTRALQDVTEAVGQTYTASAVGEVNVVTAMKQTNAVIGGEGNGGVIYPALHYGRDALVGIALFLSHLALKGVKCSELRASYPSYFISKNKIELEPGMDVDGILASVKEQFSDYPINDVDGVRINFDKEWVHLRKSNTEPIIRIYAESKDEAASNALAAKIIEAIKALV